MGGNYVINGTNPSDVNIFTTSGNINIEASGVDKEVYLTSTDLTEIKGKWANIISSDTLSVESPTIRLIGDTLLNLSVADDGIITIGDDGTNQTIAPIININANQGWLTLKNGNSQIELADDGVTNGIILKNLESGAVFELSNDDVTNGVFKFNFGTITPTVSSTNTLYCKDSNNGYLKEINITDVVPTTITVVEI